MEWEESGCPQSQLPELGRGGDESRRMVVLVDEVKASRAALGWAMLNVVRRGDVITLLHVHSASAAAASASSATALNSNLRVGGIKGTDRARRLQRLKGYQLALSFKELCDSQNPEARVEILVLEGEQGPTIVSVTKKLKASAIILGQRKRGFLRRILGTEDTPNYCMKHCDCLVLAVRQEAKRRRQYSQCKMASKVEIRQCQLTLTF